MAKKITIKRSQRVKKNFLKENCGGSAAPNVQVAPTQELPLAGDIAGMESHDAYDAGWNDAIRAIMAMINEMMPGAVPVEMAPPADIAHMDQLEEEN